MRERASGIDERPVMSEWDEKSISAEETFFSDLADHGKMKAEVLRLAAQGHSAPKLAEMLVNSPSTVRTHLERIYEKLGAPNRAAAVATAMRLGLID